MALAIEDYAVIGDCHSAALIGRDGSIDWMCLPRFDSASTFGALLGTKDHGRWLLAPVDPDATNSRAYVKDTFILVTRWVTSGGEVEVTDLMPHGDRRADVIRRVTGISGSVRMRVDLRIRFGYADALPWIRQVPEKGDHALIAVAGPDGVIVRGPKLTARDHAHVAEFTVAAGETADLTMTWFPAHRMAPDRLNVSRRIRQTAKWWTGWASSATASKVHTDAVLRSLMCCARSPMKTPAGSWPR